jgi:hypothetical protein
MHYLKFPKRHHPNLKLSGVMHGSIRIIELADMAAEHRLINDYREVY